MEKESASTGVRDYAIAGACLVFVILMGKLAISFLDNGPNVWAQCDDGTTSVSVFISTDKALKNVKCVALDGREFFANPEVFIGDVPINSEDVCKFVQFRYTPGPLRFEVWYDGKAQKRELCDRHNFSGGAGAD